MFFLLLSMFVECVQNVQCVCPFISSLSFHFISQCIQYPPASNILPLASVAKSCYMYSESCSVFAKNCCLLINCLVQPKNLRKPKAIFQKPEANLQKPNAIVMQ